MPSLAFKNISPSAKEPTHVKMEVNVPGNVQLEVWIRRIAGANSLKVDDRTVSAQASAEGYLLVTLRSGQHTVETL
jgi:hypothetical protein